MIRRFAELVQEPKHCIRGGLGHACSASYLEPGDMAGVLGAGRTRLEPGASIGEHRHPNTEELYLIVAGRGTGILNGEAFPVAEGDLFVTRAGQSHGLVNTGSSPLEFFAVLTRMEVPAP